MSHVRTPLYLRATVIIGVTVLLLGLSGIVWLPDTPLPPERYAAVRLSFDPPTVSVPISELRIVASWQNEAGERESEVGSLSESGRLFLFREAPADRPLAFAIRHEAPGGTAREITRTEGVLRYGGSLWIHVVPDKR